MKNTIKIIIFTFFVISFIGINKLQAQDSCQIAIVDATRAFENGDYEKVISLVGERINTCKYNKNTKQQLRKILSASYYEIDEIEKADQQTYRFIKKNPEYQIQSTDPDLFKKSLSNFAIRPRLSVGANLSFQRVSFNVLKQYQVLDYPDYNVNYTNKNYQILEFSLQYYFNQKLSIILDLGTTRLKTEKTFEYPDYYTLTYNESNFYGLTNVVISYKLFNYKLISVSAVGGIKNYILQPGTSNYTIAYNLNNSGIIETEGTIKNGRRELNSGYILGLSLNTQYERFNIKIQPRFSADFLQNNIPSYRYENPNLNLNYYYIDDDYSLKQIELLIGVSYNLSYKVKHKYRKNFK